MPETEVAFFRGASLATALFRTLLAAALASTLALTARAGDSVDLRADEAVHDLGSNADFLIDRDGTLRLEDVRTPAVAARFQRAGGRHPNFGFTRDWIWLRVKVRPAPGDTRRWTLEISYPPLDIVEVYTPVAGSGDAPRYRRRVAGDTVPFAWREIPSQDYLFGLDLQPGIEQTLYVRVRSDSSVTVPMRVLSPAGLEDERWGESFVLALFFGALLALALFNLLLYFTLRDRSYLAYVAFIGATAMAYLCYNGLAFQFLWPGSPDWNNRSTLVFAYLTIAAGAWFARSFLKAWEHGRRHDIPMIAIMAISAGCAIGTLGPLPYWLGARAFPFLAIAVCLSIASNAIRAIRRGYRPARAFLAAWAALIAGLLAFALRALEILPGNFVTLHGMQIGSLAEALLLSQALALRFRALREATESAQASALATKEAALQLKEEALEASRIAEQDLENLVAERVQELARINRTLEAEIFERKRAEELLRRLAYHDQLTGLPNRTLLRDRFAMAASAARRNETHLALLVIDLDHFRAINEAHGHDLGDDLLVSFAKLLQTRLRETDTIARLGGDEFVVLVNDLATPGEAGRLAEKILGILHEPIRIGADQSLRVSASIGIALHGADGQLMEPLLKRAEASMYAAKDAGRGVYRFATVPADA